MPSNVKPTPIALVLCDTIYQEPGGKVALVGLFNAINTVALPTKHPRMAVFASVTGLRPGSKAKLDIVHSETEQVVVSAEGPFPPSADPVCVADLHFILNNVVFQEEGKYYIRFWGNDHLLMMRPFHVNRVKKQGDQKNANT